MTYLCVFQHCTGASARDICNNIRRLRTTHPTPANIVSSRTHAVVSYEEQKNHRLYGVLLDVVADEESFERALMNDEKVISDTIALNNSDWRMMISESTIAHAAESNIMQVRLYVFKASEAHSTIYGSGNVCGWLIRTNTAIDETPHNTGQISERTRLDINMDF